MVVFLPAKRNTISATKILEIFKGSLEKKSKPAVF